MYDDYRDFFFALIGRSEGALATGDWKPVLESLPGRGMGTNPAPGERQPQDAPHHGVTVMIDAGGNARGRIWLPADDFTTDGNGNRWFTHEMQVIADGPTPGSMIWAWQDKGGATVRPFSGGSTPPPVEPPVPPPNTGLELQVVKNTADIEHLTAIVQQQHEQIERLEARVSRSAYKGDAVAVTGSVTFSRGPYTWTGKIL